MDTVIAGAGLSGYDGPTLLTGDCLVGNRSRSADQSREQAILFVPSVFAREEHLVVALDHPADDLGSHPDSFLHIWRLAARLTEQLMKARNMHITEEVRRDVAGQLNGYFWNSN